jgi:hypothetical protein
MALCFWFVLQANGVETKGCESSWSLASNLKLSIFLVIDQN